MGENELYHYGVLGMKWGIRRGTNSLAKASSKAKADKAISKLDKHRAKSSAKLTKLKKAEPKLQKRADRAIEKVDVKSARYQARAARYKRKASRRFTSNSSYRRNMQKALKMESLAADLAARSANAKAKIAKNKRLQETFSKGINSIDKAKVDYGKAYIDNIRAKSG